VVRVRTQVGKSQPRSNRRGGWVAAMTRVKWCAP
jgi:hypothetical protein